MQQCDKYKTINDANHSERVESELPGSMGSYRSSKSADGLPQINSRGQHTDGNRPCFSLMIVSRQRQGGRYIKGLADSHQRS